MADAYNLDTIRLPDMCTCCGASPAPRRASTRGYAGYRMQVVVKFPYCGRCAVHAKWVALKEGANGLVKFLVLGGFLGGAALGFFVAQLAGQVTRSAHGKNDVSTFGMVLVIGLACVMAPGLPWLLARLGDLLFGRRSPARGCCKRDPVSLGKSFHGSGYTFSFGNPTFEAVFRIGNRPIPTLPSIGDDPAVADILANLLKK